METATHHHLEAYLMPLSPPAPLHRSPPESIIVSPCYAPQDYASSIISTLAASDSNSIPFADADNTRDPQRQTGTNPILHGNLWFPRIERDYAASERFVLPEFNLGRRMLSISSPPPIPVIPFDEDFFARGWSAKYPSSRVFNIVQSDILRVGLEHYFPHHDVRITISDGGLREACITVGDKVIYHGYEGIPIRYFVTAYAGRNRRFAFYQVTGMDRSQSRTCIGDAEWPPFILAVPLRCASILRQSPSRLPNTATHSSDLDVRRDANPNSNDPDSLQIGGSISVSRHV